MSKRRADVDAQPDQTAKRVRLTKDRLSCLSDELLLRILAFVPVNVLITCQTVSKRLNTIAGDSQLWKAAYYNRFVRPRARRLPRLRDNGRQANRLDYASKISIWLDKEKLVRAGKETNWKRQYKLADNWARGSCDIHEIPLAAQRSVPSLLARLQDGVVFTMDSNSGLRAWSYKGHHTLLASLKSDHLCTPNTTSTSAPSSIAVDGNCHHGPSTRVVIGFEDGGFASCQYHKVTNSFESIYRHPASSNGSLISLDVTWPFVVTMTRTHLLSVYRYRDVGDGRFEPLLLSSFKSHTIWPPLSLSIRQIDSELVVTITFSQPTFMSGWSIGVQELRMTLDGKSADSRLATALEQGFRPLISPPQADSELDENDTLESTAGELDAGIYSSPKSLSYSHPYLLVSHADNTLTLYMVRSTSSCLSVSKGKRLWGHTSSISGAYVGGRGKAVSVSVRGDEVRVWELESSATLRRTRKFHDAMQTFSVQVTPEKKHSPPDDNSTNIVGVDRAGLASAARQEFNDDIVAQGWLGFDDENVVVLREDRRGIGSETLMVYDFT